MCRKTSASGMSLCPLPPTHSGSLECCASLCSVRPWLQGTTQSLVPCSTTTGQRMLLMRSLLTKRSIGRSKRASEPEVPRHAVRAARPRQARVWRTHSSGARRASCPAPPVRTTLSRRRVCVDRACSTAGPRYDRTYVSAEERAGLRRDGRAEGREQDQPRQVGAAANPGVQLLPLLRQVAGGAAAERPGGEGGGGEGGGGDGGGGDGGGVWRGWR